MAQAAWTAQWAARQTWVVAGVMSGTSLDGVDAVIVRLQQGEDKPLGTAGSLSAEVMGFASGAYPNTLRTELLSVQASQSVSFPKLAELEAQLDAITIHTVQKAVSNSHVYQLPLDAIALHGQTVFHQPPTSGLQGFTWQWGNPAAVAAGCQVPVVAQFRQGDMSFGGQGAPLVPYAQAMLFGQLGYGFLNVGGIANLTLFPQAPSLKTPVWAWEDVLGFDTGPGNMLLDGAAQRFFNVPYDKEGELAGQGCVNPALLAWLQGHPYYQQPAPKSTGREAFGQLYLEELCQQFPEVAPHDVLATLTQLTAWSVAKALPESSPKKLVVSGGGACNPVLIQALRQAVGALYPKTAIVTAEEAPDLTPGMGNTHMECLAFAVLGWARLMGLPGNLPVCTGACQPALLGGIWDTAKGF